MDHLLRDHFIFLQMDLPPEEDLNTILQPERPHGRETERISGPIFLFARWVEWVREFLFLILQCIA
jgi:hypothetical protein